jgi:hypothetical protein
MATKVELKAALPADFSGEPAEAMHWIKAIKAYYALNSTIYSSDNAQIMTTLNKTSKGRECLFPKCGTTEWLTPTLPRPRKPSPSSKRTLNLLSFPSTPKPHHDTNFPNSLRILSNAPTESTMMNSKSTSLTVRILRQKPRSLMKEPCATNSWSDLTVKLLR